MKRRQQFNSFHSSSSESESSAEWKKLKNPDHEDLIDILFDNIDMIDSYSFNSDSTDSPSDDSSHTTTPIPPYFKASLPRILKRDIRKKIPVMFTNVFNSCDFPLLSSFLKTFCSTEVYFTQCATATTQPNRLHLEMPTLEHLIYFLGGFQQMAPDMSFRMTGFKLKQRQDMEGTEIICEGTAVCTQMYPINPRHIAQHVLDHLPYDGAKPVVESPYEENSHLLDHYDLYQPLTLHSCGLPMLANPSVKELKVTMTFKLDELHRIQRISEAAVFIGDFPCF